MTGSEPVDRVSAVLAAALSIVADEPWGSRVKPDVKPSQAHPTADGDCGCFSPCQPAAHPCMHRACDG
jgi:hypothetical protein